MENKKAQPGIEIALGLKRLQVYFRHSVSTFLRYLASSRLDLHTISLYNVNVQHCVQNKVHMRGDKMLATNFTNVRNNFKEYCDKAIDDAQPVIVTRKDDRNVVIISLDEYNNMQENMYIFGNKEYVDRLLESKKQIEHGHAKVQELIEVEDE